MSDCPGRLGTLEQDIEDNESRFQLCVQNTSVNNAKESKNHVSHPAVYVYIDKKIHTA